MWEKRRRLPRACVPKPYGDSIMLKILRDSGGVALAQTDDQIAPQFWIGHATKVIFSLPLRSSWQRQPTIVSETGFDARPPRRALNTGAGSNTQMYREAMKPGNGLRASHSWYKLNLGASSPIPDGAVESRRVLQLPHNGPLLGTVPSPLTTLSFLSSRPESERSGGAPFGASHFFPFLPPLPVHPATRRQMRLRGGAFLFKQRRMRFGNAINITA